MRNYKAFNTMHSHSTKLRTPHIKPRNKSLHLIIFIISATIDFRVKNFTVESRGVFIKYETFFRLSGSRSRSIKMLNRPNLSSI
jgi:hypothetical protein